MANWQPSIVKPWSPSDLEAVLNDALRVLAEIGIECEHAETTRRLLEWDGASLVGGRIRFAPERVRAHVEARRASLGPPEEEDGHFTMGGCWTGPNYYDPQADCARPATVEDVVRMSRLWDARGIRGVVPLTPADVPPELVTVTSERIALENSRHLGGGLAVTDPEEIRHLIDMNLAAGRRYRLSQSIGISPLKFDHTGLAAAMCFLDDPDVSVGLGGSIPIAGATCPLEPRAAVVQSVAEELACDVLCHAVLGIAGGGFVCRVEPFDFRYATVVYGSAEWCLLHVLARQMVEYLTGRVVRAGKFRTVAKAPDPQAACERTASALWQALLGSRHFHSVGQLSLDEMFSPQQAVIDGEILRYVERALGGLDASGGSGDPVELIRAGVDEKGFMGLDDTVGRFREFYHFPEIFRHWNVSRWRAAGGPSVLSEAWDRAKRLIASSTFELPDEQLKEVRRIHDRAVRYIHDRA